MVQELRRKLTVINAAITAAVFLLLTAGYYFFLQATADRGTGTLLTALAGFCIAGGLFACGAGFFLGGRVLAPVREAWQRQQDFMADASHELKTPLTVIQTNLEVVRSSSEDTVASQSKWLDNIQEGTSSMAAIIDSLLFLARVDSRQQLLAKRPFPLREAVERAAASFEPLAAAKGVSLEVPGGAIAVEFTGDEARVKQLLAILLDNAIRHTPPGGKVSVYLSRPGPTVILSVADTGEGIEARHLPRIFDRFYQAGKSGNSGGAGLGLAIAKWITESHGGTIAAASSPGEGSVFTVELPADG